MAAAAFDPSSALTCVVLRHGRIVAGPAAMPLSGSLAYSAALSALRELRRGAESVSLSFGLLAAVGAATDVHLGLPDGPWQDVLTEEELRVPPGRFFWLAEPGGSAPALVGAVIPPPTIRPPERRYEDQDSARVLLEVSITDESQLGDAREYWAACATIEEAKKPCLVLVPFAPDSPLSVPPHPFGSLRQHASAMGHALLAEMVFEALDHWYPTAS